MKIAYIGQKGIPAKFGGVETHVEELAKRMAKRGHDVFVYVRNNYTDKNLKTYEGINLIHLPSISTKHLDAISHTFLCSIHALFQKYDVIHYQAIGPSFLSFIPKLFLRKTIIVATYHCQDYFHKKWNWFAKLALHLGEYVTCTVPDKTITVSKILRSLIKNKFGKVAVYIPNGANVEKRGDTSEIEKWGLEKNNYILSLGRLIRHKGIHYLIQAWINLRKKGLTQGKKLVIVGDGFHTDDYVKELKDMAKGIPDIIFTGSQTGLAQKQLFSHAYLFVQPSESEGLSTVLLEAMGYEKAVLASDIPENLEVASGIALFFENGNALDLENKLSHLIQKPEEVSIMSKRGLEKTQEKYNWDKITLETESVYTDISLTKKIAKIYPNE